MLVAQTIWGMFPIGSPHAAEFVKREVTARVVECDGYYAVLETMYVHQDRKNQSVLEANRILAIRRTEQEAERVARAAKGK